MESIIPTKLDVDSLLVHPKAGEQHCPSRSSDNVSECSTSADNQEFDAGNLDDGLSVCCSNIDLQVETLIIFDWDDTLFPTSWLAQNMLLDADVHPSFEQQTQMERVADCARLILQTAVQIGKVVIVTNAQEGWIEMSCTKFMPSLASLLETVDKVSAQSRYRKFSEDPAEWKRLAFADEVRGLYGSCTDLARNIISVGDSMHELSALKSVTEEPNCCGKSIKLLENPSIEQLIEQHDVVASSLLEVAEHNGDLDIEVGVDNAN
jgi:hypothetical protein